MIFYEILQIFHKRLPVSQLFNVWPLTHREFAILWRVWRHYLSVYRMSPTKGTIKCGWADDKWKEKGDSAAFVRWWQTQRIWDTTWRGTSALSGERGKRKEWSPRLPYALPFCHFSNIQLKKKNLHIATRRLSDRSPWNTGSGEEERFRIKTVEFSKLTPELSGKSQA